MLSLFVKHPGLLTGAKELESHSKQTDGDSPWKDFFLNVVYDSFLVWFQVKTTSFEDSV